MPWYNHDFIVVASQSPQKQRSSCINNRGI
jgi:hypothetical protein